MRVILYNIVFQTKNTQTPYWYTPIFSTTDINAKTIEKQIQKDPNLKNINDIAACEKCIEIALQALNIAFITNNDIKNNNKITITIKAIKNILIS